MANLVVTAANVRPVNAAQCMIRQVDSGEAIDVGEWVYLKAADGLAWLTAGTAVVSAFAIGVVVAIGSQGQTVGLAAGEKLSVVMLGPVAGFTVSAGVIGYVSNTAGAVADAAGTKAAVIGIGLPDNIFYVRPEVPSTVLV